MAAIDKHIRGHAQKARIRASDSLAEALEFSYEHIKAQFGPYSNDAGRDIKMARLPDHLQLLLMLALSPTELTLTYADATLEKRKDLKDPHTTLTWKEILAEEPFEGQHWEGACGLDPGSVVPTPKSLSLSDSSPSLSSLEESDLEDSISSWDFRGFLPRLDSIKPPSPGAYSVGSSVRLYRHRQEVEQLHANQYWKSEWRSSIAVCRAFDIGEPSTLGPSLTQALGYQLAPNIARPDQERYINEHDCVREVLVSLQGREGLMLAWCHNSRDKFTCIVPSPSAPRLAHLTLASQQSILQYFAKMCTVLELLRNFTASVFSKAAVFQHREEYHQHLSSANAHRSRTLEAFADAIDIQIGQFVQWCAAREENICLAQSGIGEDSVVSLLSLDKAVRENISSTFDVLWDVTENVLTRAACDNPPPNDLCTIAGIALRMPPSAVTSLLLDSLFQAVESAQSMGDAITADTLMNVFVLATEPLWFMIGQWLKYGTDLRDLHAAKAKDTLHPEFFIEGNFVSLMDPTFWTEGYTVRESVSGDDDSTGSIQKTTPLFLGHIVADVLSAGKAIGLLRSLGVLRRSSEAGNPAWPKFRTLLESSTAPRVLPSNYTTGFHHHQAPLPSHLGHSVDALRLLVHDHLLRYCQASQRSLKEVLFDDCDLWRHLLTVEDLYLMRRGDAMSQYCEVLFARMDSRQHWSDFHFLNTAFRDITDASCTGWVQSSLVRLSYRGSRDMSGSRTVKTIDGITIEYSLPFPLTYIFGPRAFEVYGAVFVFLVQIRRAKTLLDRILIRGTVASVAQLSTELRIFYATRSKLLWFHNMLLNFLTINVLHTQIMHFHASLKRANSLDDVINIHNEHLTKIQSRCLLHPNTSALHRAIISVLDMSIHFTDCFTAFAGDVNIDVSRKFLLPPRPHRSRRHRRLQRDVIGFSQSLSESKGYIDESDSDEGDDPVNANVLEPNFSVVASSSMSFADDSFLVRVDKMSTELDGLVRFIRRSVESLSEGSNEGGPVFGIFAFALENWDM